MKKGKILISFVNYEGDEIKRKVTSEELKLISKIINVTIL